MDGIEVLHYYYKMATILFPEEGCFVMHLSFHLKSPRKKLC